MPQLLCPVVVGRDQELGEIVDAMGKAAAGQGGALFVIGEAGLGKSRLVREVAALARGRGVVVLLGRAVAEGRAGSFRALSEALLGAFRGGVPPNDPDLDPFRAHLGRIVPQWRSPDDVVGEGTDGVMLAEGLLRLLRSIAGDIGCLLLLEDLHWADA
jgi:predicted ATPase